MSQLLTVPAPRTTRVAIAMGARVVSASGSDVRNKRGWLLICTSSPQPSCPRPSLYPFLTASTWHGDVWVANNEGDRWWSGVRTRGGMRNLDSGQGGQRYRR